jgi:phosphoserine aminotransferase
LQLTAAGRPLDHLWRGEAINTISLLCVEDALSSLAWIEGIGGLPAMTTHTKVHYRLIADWVAATPWVDFLAADEKIRSSTSVCLGLVEP